MGLRNPSRMAIDPKTDVPYAAWVGPDAGSPSATQGPSTYENATQLPSAGNYGWPYCMGNQQAYRDRIADGSLRTTNAAGYVNGGPAASPTNGWYDCKNLVNDSTNNTGLTRCRTPRARARTPARARSQNVWYSRGNPGNANGCPNFAAPSRAPTPRPNYGGTPTQLCPYLTASGATVFTGPVYRYNDAATDNSVALARSTGTAAGSSTTTATASAKHALLLDPATDQDGCQPVYADSFRGGLPWGANYMDSKFGPDGALYVQVYEGFFSTGPQRGPVPLRLHGRRRHAGPRPAVAVDRHRASGPVLARRLRRRRRYEWDFGDGTPASTGANPTHTYAATGTYDAKLTVTYADGEKASKTVTRDGRRRRRGADHDRPDQRRHARRHATPRRSRSRCARATAPAPPASSGSSTASTAARGRARDNTGNAEPFVTKFNVTAAATTRSSSARATGPATSQTRPGSVTFAIDLAERRRLLPAAVGRVQRHGARSEVDRHCGPPAAARRLATAA